MSSFLITFKPSIENPERGWPLEELQKLARQNRAGAHPIEGWRFHNRRDVSNGDRVFLLLQGKEGPAIIGYGTVAGKADPKTGVPVRFESIVDPTIEVLADRRDLLAIDGGQRFWRIQSSGVVLPDPIAAALEVMVVGKPPHPKRTDSTANPDWTRDELILALDFYLKHRPNPPGKGSKEIRDLSSVLNLLASAGTPATLNSSYCNIVGSKRYHDKSCKEW